MRRQLPSLNLTDQIEIILRDICARVPDFAHVDSRRLLACIARTRQAGPAGVYAKIAPMRFEDGKAYKINKEQVFSLPQLPTPHGDILYLIYVYFPRFFTLPAERRILTLIHELYHIAPDFDGTIRRVGAGVHGSSRRQFNDNLQPLVDAYLTATAGAEQPAVLHVDAKALTQQYTLVGRSMPIPKAIRIR